MMGSDFPPLSYRELQNVIRAVHGALRVAGFGRTARIAIAMANAPQAALATVSVACSAVSIPLNPRQTLSEAETSLAVLRPDALLVVRGTDTAARLAAERARIPIIEAAPKSGVLGFTVAEQETIAVADTDAPDPEAPAFILQTSGTAAEPKLVPYSHRNMVAAAIKCQTLFDLTPQDRCLSVSPIFYAHGLKVTVFTPLLTGGTIAFPVDASKFDYSEWLCDLKPSWFSAGPTLHRLVFDHTQTRPGAKTGHSLRFILSSGARLPRDVLVGLESTLGIPVMEHYSSTEASLIAANLPKPGHSKLGTCGVPWPNTALIVAADGRRLPPGEQGEILVAGETVISGYLNAPELNRTRFVNGWLKTGDIGSIDEEGFLTLHGRKDDLINRGGEKISPIEIDDALMRHPAIAQAAAFSVPHPRLGEDVAAAIVLRPGVTAEPEEIRAYLQEQIAFFKVPRRIVIRDRLPTGPTGKVLRRQLSENLRENAAAETKHELPAKIENASVDGNLMVQLTVIWEQLLKIAPVSVDDDFFEIGGDSLLAMDMHAELERLTGSPISSAILFEAPTIRNLAKKLSDWGYLNKSPKPVIRVNPTGQQTPLFFFHYDYYGRGYYVMTLARLLGPDQPLLIVGPHGDGEEPDPHTIEAIAADRLSVILETQPKGPYRLGGRCVGGLVAFEVARLLIASGKTVEIVVMINSPTVGASRIVKFLLSTMKCSRPVAGSAVDIAIAWTFWKCQVFQRFWEASWTRRWAAARRRVSHAWCAIKRKLPERPGGGVVRSLSRSPKAEPDGKNLVAMSNYYPKPLAARVTFFSIDYGAGAWRNLSPDFEVVKSPGTHSEPDFEDIARHLKARMLTLGEL